MSRVVKNVELFSVCTRDNGFRLCMIDVDDEDEIMISGDMMMICGISLVDYYGMNANYK